MKHGRRGFAALLALILAAGSGLPVSAAEVKVTSDQKKVTNGSEITLTLTLDEAVEDVICFDYRVYFDEDSFSLKESSIGTACAEAQISTKPMIYDSEKGSCYSINYIDTTTSGSTIQQGELCRLTFTAKKDMAADWQDTFRVEREHFATEDYWDTLKETDNGKVSYDVDVAVLYGDVDGNGRINTSDAAMAYGYVNGRITFDERQKKVVDVNGDGKINTSDAAFIYAYVNGRIQQFPVEKQSQGETVHEVE